MMMMMMMMMTILHARHAGDKMQQYIIKTTEKVKNSKTITKLRPIKVRVI